MCVLSSTPLRFFLVPARIHLPTDRCWMKGTGGLTKCIGARMHRSRGFGGSPYAFAGTGLLTVAVINGRRGRSSARPQCRTEHTTVPCFPPATRLLAVSPRGTALGRPTGRSAAKRTGATPNRPFTSPEEDELLERSVKLEWQHPLPADSISHRMLSDLYLASRMSLMTRATPA